LLLHTNFKLQYRYLTDLQYVCCYRGVHVFARTSAHFSRDTPDGFQHIDAHFTSHPQMVTHGIEFDCKQLLNELQCSVDRFDGRGSGFVLDVYLFTLVITQFTP